MLSAVKIFVDFPDAGETVTFRVINSTLVMLYD